MNKQSEDDNVISVGIFSFFIFLIINFWIWIFYQPDFLKEFLNVLVLSNEVTSFFESFIFLQVFFIILPTSLWYIIIKEGLLPVVKNSFSFKFFTINLLISFVKTIWCFLFVIFGYLYSDYLIQQINSNTNLLNSINILLTFAFIGLFAEISNALFPIKHKKIKISICVYFSSFST